MNQNEMIHSIRAEIAKLQRVLDVLEEGPSEVKEQRRPGRPKGSGSKATNFNPEEFAPKKRTMSAEGKAKIAEAQKKRWEAKKAIPTKRVAVKQATKETGKKTARSVVSATVAKASGAGRRTNAAQKRATATKPDAAKKMVAKKTMAKKTSRPTPKPAKQANSSSTEPQATS